MVSLEFSGYLASRFSVSYFHGSHTQANLWLVNVNASTACPGIIKAVDVPCARRISTTRRCVTSVPSSIPGLVFLRFRSTPEVTQYPPIRKPHDLAFPLVPSCIRICGYSYSTWHYVFLLRCYFGLRTATFSLLY